MWPIVKKIEDNYVVWFPQSNRWVRFEEPAWYVNELFQEGFEMRTIAERFTRRYGIEAGQSIQLVETICGYIQESSQTSNLSSGESDTTDPENFALTEPYSTKMYSTSGILFGISFSSPLAEYYIHPPLAHLETRGDSCIQDVSFNIIDQGEQQIIKRNGASPSAWVYNDFMKIKKRLYIDLAGLIYNKKNSDWLCFVHASALTNGTKTILLSSTSGSGKSTLAALMQTKGIQVISDDFVPIGHEPVMVYPFPAAISVKQGAFPVLSKYYPDWNTYPFKTTCQGKIGYIPIRDAHEMDRKAREVKEIVFVRYDPGVKGKLDRLTTLEALKLFHDQSWVSFRSEHARTFINWFAERDCYTLVYSDPEAGMNNISKLFGNRGE